MYKTKLSLDLNDLTYPILFLFFVALLSFSNLPTFTIQIVSRLYFPGLQVGCGSDLPWGSLFNYSSPF